MASKRADGIPCKFCGCDTLDGSESCPPCREVVRKGHAARLGMLPMESCPWLLGEPEYEDVYGDPAHHDDVKFGERGSCPWCSGWSEAERELFAQAIGGAR